MRVWTVQLARYRRVPEGFTFMDTTIKSGKNILSPTWEMVSRHKAGTLSDQEYTEMYIQLLRERYQSNRQAFIDIINIGDIAFGCYCTAGKFCHRYILIDIFRNICTHLGIPFEYCGEVQ